MTLNNREVVEALLKILDSWNEQKAATDAEGAALRKQAKALLSQVKVAQGQVKVAQDQIKVAQDQIKVAHDQAKVAHDQAKAAHDLISVHIEQTQAHSVSSANLDDLREFLRALAKTMDVEEDDTTE